MRKTIYGIILAICCALTSCQKAAIEEVEEAEEGNVRFRIAQIEQVPFDMSDYTRAASIGDLCTMINLAVYQDGERIKQVNQKSSEKGFGTLSLTLDAGTYEVVILAHNGSKSPTMTKPEKVTFSDGVTDTFWWAQEITVSGDRSYDVNMKRIVAMFRLITTDNVPADVKKMQFYYTGGSSSINALTGVGCVNSRQTVNLTVGSDMTGKPATFEVYTFPRDDSESLTMKVSALSSGSETLYGRTFEDVPITRNMITQYKGKFFTTTDPGDDPGTDPDDGTNTISFDLDADGEWSDIIDQAY